MHVTHLDLQIFVEAANKWVCFVWRMSRKVSITPAWILKSAVEPRSEPAFVFYLYAGAKAKDGIIYIIWITVILLGCVYAYRSFLHVEVVIATTQFLLYFPKCLMLRINLIVAKWCEKKNVLFGTKRTDKDGNFIRESWNTRYAYLGHKTGCMYKELKQTVGLHFLCLS